MHTPAHLVTTSSLILGNSGSSEYQKDYSLRYWFICQWHCQVDTLENWVTQHLC